MQTPQPSAIYLRVESRRRFVAMGGAPVPPPDETRTGSASHARRFDGNSLVVT